MLFWFFFVTTVFPLACEEVCVVQELKKDVCIFYKPVYEESHFGWFGGGGGGGGSAPDLRDGMGGGICP